MNDDPIDPRKAGPAEVLARVSAARLPRPPQDAALVRAGTAMQKTIAGICEEVLRFDCVGMNDNFFALGGDSLQMTQIMSRVREQLDVELTFEEFFATGTIGGLAELVESRRGQGAAERGAPESA